MSSSVVSRMTDAWMENQDTRRLVLSEIAKASLDDARTAIRKMVSISLSQGLDPAPKSYLDCARRFAQALSKIAPALPVHLLQGRNLSYDEGMDHISLMIEGLLHGDDPPYTKVGRVLEWFKSQRQEARASGSRVYTTDSTLQKELTSLLFNVVEIDRRREPDTVSPHEHVKQLFQDPEAPSHSEFFASTDFRIYSYVRKHASAEDIAEREKKRRDFFEKSAQRRQVLQRMRAHELYYIGPEWAKIIGNTDSQPRLITRHAPLVLWLHLTMQEMTPKRWKDEKPFLMRAVMEMDFGMDIHQAHSFLLEPQQGSDKTKTERAFEKLKTLYPDDERYKKWFASTLKSTAKTWRILRRYRVRTLPVTMMKYGVFRPSKHLAENIPIGDITDRTKIKGPSDLVFGFFSHFKDSVVMDILNRTHPEYGKIYSNVLATATPDLLGMDKEEALQFRIQLLQTEFQRIATSNTSDAFLEIPANAFDLEGIV